MKQKPPRWVQITAAVLRRYLALDMAVYAGSATLFLLTASFPLLMWVLMLVNLVPGFSVEGVAELLADFLPQIPEIQTAILGLLQNLSGQSAQFVASLAVLTTIVSASGGMNALQIGLQRLTPGSHRTLLNRLLAIGYTFMFELLLLVMLALQGMHSLFARFADTLPFFRHYAAIVAPLQRVASIGRIVSVPLLFGLLLLIYTYVPGGRRTPRSQLPGTIFATAGWLVFSGVFSFYIRHFWRLSYIYGSLTAVILIILWLYVIINLLFLPSFSMAKKITDISGRGVGLDVVKSNIEALGGDVEVKTELGVGTTFTVRLPLTLAIIQALMVEIRDEKYAIALGSISNIEDIPVKDIKYVEAQEVIHLRGKVIPLIRMDQVLDIEPKEEEPESLTVVIVQKGENLAGLVVDNLIGQQEIVIKSLGKYINNNKIISGATILGDGEVALILDVNVLM